MADCISTAQVAAMRWRNLRQTSWFMDSEAQELRNKLWRHVVSPSFMSSKGSGILVNHV